MLAPPHLTVTLPPLGYPLSGGQLLLCSTSNCQSAEQYLVVAAWPTRLAVLLSNSTLAHHDQRIPNLSFQIEIDERGYLGSRDRGFAIESTLNPRCKLAPQFCCFTARCRWLIHLINGKCFQMFSSRPTIIQPTRTCARSVLGLGDDQVAGVPRNTSRRPFVLFKFRCPTCARSGVL